MYCWKKWFRKKYFNKIIVGLIEPDEGSILIDNIELKKNLGNWMKIVGYKPQEIGLIEGTSVRKIYVLPVEKEKINKLKFDENCKITIE